MEGGPPMFGQDCTCPALLEDPEEGFPYGAVTHFGRPFQSRSSTFSQATGLVRVRSPLLAESRLMSFPPVTEMFQFTGFAPRGYVFTARYRRSGGFPHSEISGSKPARGSPKLIAACYVLHRLSVPRHPPNALLTLVRETAVRREQPEREVSASGNVREDTLPRNRTSHSWAGRPASKQDRFTMFKITRRPDRPHLGPSRRRSCTRARDVAAASAKTWWR